MKSLRQGMQSLTGSVAKPFRSIRVRLILAVGVVVLVGLVNVGVSYWGARRRADTFSQLSVAIQRQSLLTEAHNALEEQRRIVATTAAGAGGGVPAAEAERQAFTTEVDRVPELLALLTTLAGGEERIDAEAMRASAFRLAEEWKALYLARGLDAAAAGEALAAADPRADQLIHVAIPAAMDAERRHIARLTTSFRRTEETVSIAAWSILLLSAGIGGVLLYLALRTLPGTVRDLVRGAERIGAGDLHHRIRVRSQDELGAVAARFNAMAERLCERDEELRLRSDELREAMTAAEVANQAKSRFLANTSHELRTPLNAIIGYSEMLIEEAEERQATELVPDLEKIRAAGRHLLALINDVLDLSRVEAGEARVRPEPVDLGELIDEVAADVRPLVAQRHNKLELEAPDRPGWLSTDAGMLRQILFNLLSNAAKFTEDGTIRFEAALEDDDLGVTWFRFTVADTGVGMTPQQLAQLFEPFMHGDSISPRVYGGTGLGLTLSRRFVELLGGSMRVESEVGLGTSFHVELPVVRLAQPPVVDTGPAERIRLREPSPRAEVAEQRRTILVIDDDASAREMVERMLAHQGYRVLVAASGEEGLQLAKTHRPDLITLDVIMPGADGWAVLKALKASPELSGIPVVMLTVLEHRNVAYTLGASDFLTKPIDRDALLAAVRRQLQERQDTVLVVEDDRDTRALLRKGLTRGGMVVVEAENGSAALDALRVRRPGLVLLDLMMPEVDGFEFIERMGMEAEWGGIPVIVLTAKDITEADRARLRGRVVKVLRKGGLPGEELLTEVRRALDSSSGPAAAGAHRTITVPARPGGTA